MKHVVKMGSGATINIPKFHKNWFRYSKLFFWEGGGEFTDTQPTFNYSK